MGGPSISRNDMDTFYKANSYIRNSRHEKEVFRSTSIFKAFDPSQMKLPREACDSPLSPRSRGCIIAYDVTGSMGMYPHEFIKDGFPRFINQLYEAVSYDPHIMFMGVGDVAAHDNAPLQVTQFETDLRILDQLQKIWLEGGGGGNGSESYILPWYFAAKHISMDCFNKRGEKGFLFTIGDDGPTPRVTRREINQVFGNNDSLDVTMLSSRDCLEMASEKFHCYHVNLYDGYYEYESNREWKNLMGSHVCNLREHKYLPELLTTILRMYEGLSKTEAIRKIRDSNARRIVEDALKKHEETVTDVTVKSDESDIEVF